METERTWTEKTTSDKTFAEEQALFDSNLGEQSGDGKCNIDGIIYNNNDLTISNFSDLFDVPIKLGS